MKSRVWRESTRETGKMFTHCLLLLLNPDEGGREAASAQMFALVDLWGVGVEKGRRTRVACRFPLLPSFSPLARGIIAFPHFSKRRFEMCFWNRNEIHPDQKQQPPPRDTLNGIVPRCSFLIYGSFSPVFGLLAILIPPCAALASFTYRNTDRVTAIGCEILHHKMQQTQNFTLAPFMRYFLVGERAEETGAVRNGFMG